MAQNDVNKTAFKPLTSGTFGVSGAPAKLLGDEGAAGELRRPGESRSQWLGRLCEPHVPLAVKTLVELRDNSSRDSVRKDASKDLIVMCVDAEAASKDDKGDGGERKVIYLVDADRAQELLSQRRDEEQRK